MPWPSDALRGVREVPQDIRHAWRLLWRAKGFTVTAGLTLALGLAASTVMFTLIHGVLLRPLPVRDQDRLILAWKEAHGSQSARYPFGDREITAVAEASRLLEQAAGVTRNGVAGPCSPMAARRRTPTSRSSPAAFSTCWAFDHISVDRSRWPTTTPERRVSS